MCDSSPLPDSPSPRRKRSRSFDASSDVESKYAFHALSDRPPDPLVAVPKRNFLDDGEELPVYNYTIEMGGRITTTVCSTSPSSSCSAFLSSSEPLSIDSPILDSGSPASNSASHSPVIVTFIKQSKGMTDYVLFSSKSLLFPFVLVIVWLCSFSSLFL